jgi:hypothetical protein
MTFQRRIYLKGGNYLWRTYIAHWAHADGTRWAHDYRYLPSGWHTWKDCLTWSGGYHVTSWLNIGFTGVSLYGGWGDGSYHWGGALDLRD